MGILSKLMGNCERERKTDMSFSLGVLLHDVLVLVSVMHSTPLPACTITCLRVLLTI
jgi:predicted membrane chloride channel (bestrophin family)